MVARASLGSFIFNWASSRYSRITFPRTQLPKLAMKLGEVFLPSTLKVGNFTFSTWLADLRGTAGVYADDRPSLLQLPGLLLYQSYSGSLPLLPLAPSIHSLLLTSWSLRRVPIFIQTLLSSSSSFSIWFTSCRSSSSAQPVLDPDCSPQSIEHSHQVL